MPAVKFNETPATLGQAQRMFCRIASQFIVDVNNLPLMELTYGEAYRTPEQAKRNAELGIGIANSLHTKRLAIDLNLFIDGQYQSDSRAYRGIGLLWKSYHILCRWGGDFRPKPDGNHFSIEWEGVM